MINALWPHWLRPFWLLLLPVLVWLLWLLWHRQRRAGRWQSLLPAAFHGVLLSGGQGRVSRLPWIILGLAWLLALLALVGPSWQRVEQANLKPADPLVVLLEMTPAMLAADVLPDRLEQAKRKLLDLLQARGDAQTAVVVYAGSAHTLVPLSDDLATTRNLLEALKPAIMPEPGRRADLAVAKALTLLVQGAQGQGQLLLIASNLDEQERRGIREVLGTRDEPLHILGVGTAEGAPIVQAGGGFLTDAQGAIVLPRLDSAGLRRFAEERGGNYRSARLDDEDLRGLGLLDRPQDLREDGEPTRLQVWADQGHWLLLPLLLLAACAGRRGWLFCLPLFFMLPPPSQAMTFDDLWLRPDQQGQRLLQAQRPAEAAERFEHPQWQGQALYQAGDYAGAAERFARDDSAVGHYNRGNALAKANELEAALEAYEQALQRQPDLQPALSNKALIEELLRQQQEKQQQPQAQQDDTQPQQNEQKAQGEQSAPQSGQPGASPPGQPAADTPQAAADQSTQPGEPGEASGATPAKPTPSAPGETPGQAAGEAPDAKPAQGAGPGDESAAEGERRQALEQWLRQIPDDPGELLRRKFWYDQQQRQEASQ